MRPNINLNTYFDKMKLEDMNQIWSRMVDLKYRVDQLTHLETKDHTGETFPISGKPITEQDVRNMKAMAQSGMRYEVRKIDKIMVSIGMESLSGTEEKGRFTDEDYSQIIERYHFLMAEPEK